MGSTAVQKRPQRNRHSPPAEVSPEALEVLHKVDAALEQPPIPGPKPWTDDLERAAIWHAYHSAPPIMALCAAGMSQRSAESYLSSEPPETWHSACVALSERLKQAELASATTVFHRIYKASEDPKCWTAGAWLMERKHGYVQKQQSDTGPSIVVNIAQMHVTGGGDKPAIRQIADTIDAEVVQALPSPEARSGD